MTLGVEINFHELSDVSRDIFLALVLDPTSGCRISGKLNQVLKPTPSSLATATVAAREMSQVMTFADPSCLTEVFS